MSWAHPYLALLAAPLVLLLAALAQRVRRRALALTVSTGAASPHLTGSVSRPGQQRRAALMWSGLALALFAVAGPRWGLASTETTMSGADVVVLIDCSRSMLATDCLPSRSAVARRKLLELMAAAPELRLALVPFALVPAVRCPATGDAQALSLMLADCTPDLFPAEAGLQGTNIAAAVQEGLRLCAQDRSPSSALLLLSDGGDDQDAAIQEAGAKARAAEIPIFSLLVGDPASEAAVAINGRQQAVPADRTALERLAGASGGRCQSLSSGPEDVRALITSIEHAVAMVPWRRHEAEAGLERFQWPLAAALLLLLAGALVPIRVRSGITGRALPAAGLLLLLACSVSAPAAEEDADSERALAAALLPGPTPVSARLETFLLLHPGSATARYDLGTLLLASDAGAAVEQLREAASLAGADATLQGAAEQNLALALLYSGRLEEAATAAASAATHDHALAGPCERIIALVRQRERAASAPTAPTRLLIAPHGLPDATLGMPYAQVVEVDGAVEPVRLAALPGLPAGWSVGEDGTITGTPLQAGTLALALCAQAGQLRGESVVLLQVRPPGRIAVVRLPDAVLGLPYRAELASSGCAGARWSARQLPHGLAIAAAQGHEGAVIEGIPDLACSGQLEISAIAPAGTVTATVPLRVVTTCAPALLDLPDATQGAPYRLRIPLRGPDAQYRWTGAAQDGLHLEPDGTLLGIPQAAGALTMQLVITADDQTIGQVSAELALTVVPAPRLTGSPEIHLLAEHVVERPLSWEDGVAPCSGMLLEGTLPSGLRLDADLCLRGVAGPPSRTQVRIGIQDRWGARSERTFAVVVEAPVPAPAESKAATPGGEPPGQQPQQNSPADQGSAATAPPAAPDQQPPPAGSAGSQPQRQSSAQEQRPSTPGATAGSEDGSDPANVPAPGQDGERTRQAIPSAAGTDPGGSAQARAQGGQGETGLLGQPGSDAGRWLESLPPEDRQALQRQLLDQGSAATGSRKPW